MVLYFITISYKKKYPFINSLEKKAVMEKATKLRIIVSREGTERANLTFPIATLKHIESLMPEMVLERLKARNIDLAAILAKVKSTGYVPQTIFEMDEYEKSYRVWIE